MAEIKVLVTKFADRKNWIAYYDDPLSGKRITRSTKCEKKKDAEKFAAKWEGDLLAGRYKPRSNVTWEDFRERYEAEVLPSLADRTGDVVASVFSTVERICNPSGLSGMTAERLSYLQKTLRDEGRAEATIRSYLAHLKAAFRWATKMGMLADVPEIVMPRRAKGGKIMKGRPLATEEFERMLAKISTALFERIKRPTAKMRMPPPNLDAETKAAVIASWQGMLRGLWLSGLRLGEALNLSWDDPTAITVDLSGRRPMFRILAECEKGNQDRLLPMTPDFAEFLQAIPQEDRTGHVFKLLGVRGRGCRDQAWVSKIISRAGKAALIPVHTDARGKVKHATAHDLRRSFGFRWSRRVMPPVLQELMRHEDIQTTMRYYVGQNAEATADAVWEAFARVNKPVNSCDSGQSGDHSETPQTLEE